MRLRQVTAQLTIDPVERKLGGTVSGVLWTLGGLTLLSYPWLPGIPRQHVALNTAIAGLALIWGLCSLVAFDWDRANPLRIQISTALAFPAVAGAVWATGGSDSSAWIYLFWVGLFAAYFYRRAVAAAYLLACVLVQALPLLYDGQFLRDGFLAQLLTASAGYMSIGGAILAGKAHQARLRARAEALAAEQSAQRRVATAVVSGDSPDRVLELGATEVAALLGANVAAVLQLTGEDTVCVAGSYSDETVGELPQGLSIPITEGRLADVLVADRPLRISEVTPGSFPSRFGCGSAVVASVSVRGVLWGAVAVGSARRAWFGAADEQQLTAFCSLLGSAIANLDDRAKLSSQALSDPLTGLANHRALRQRLNAEVAAASRHGRTLSVAMIDVDNFKDINDVGGHEAGDEALRQVASSLRSLARSEDTIGRPGGDEFMWILPDTTREQALVAVERARGLIYSSIAGPLRTTSSAGICDTRTTEEPAELVRLADVALYASKSEGRDRTTVYDADITVAISSSEHEEWHQRSQALGGLRALARAIDAKDPANHGHSERVADFCGRLAEAAGWREERVMLLREAALVHDIGKIGVPDTLLRKRGALSTRERGQMREHAELSGRIVGSILTAEQVLWIQRHHERPDGSGYPFGLSGDAIPAGAALIALADAWDVMAVGRTYSPRRSRDAAFTECIELAGRQFTHEAVAALVALQEMGELESRVPRGGDVSAFAGR